MRRPNLTNCRCKGHLGRERRVSRLDHNGKIIPEDDHETPVTSWTCHPEDRSVRNTEPIESMEALAQKWSVEDLKGPFE